MGSTPQRHRRPVVAGLGDAQDPPWLTAERAAAVRAAEQPPFDDAEFEARLAEVRGRMAEERLDGLVVFRPSSVEYLCGYHTAETAPQPLLVTAEETVLYVPDLEVGRALASARADRVRFCGYADALSGLDAFLGDAAAVLPHGARVGVETAHSSTPPHAVTLLRDRGLDVAHPDHLVERVRLVLSEAELGCVEQAAAVTEAGAEAGFAAAAEPEATDSSVAAAIAAALYRHADSPSAWGPVVATGERGGIPHSSWVDRPLGAGPTFLEFAGTHRRYHAPVMRTVFRGEPTPASRRLTELAQTALAAVLETAAPGVTGAEVADAAWRALGRLPSDVVFHGLFGYPVGLAHKPHWMDGVPFHLVPGNHEPLRAGMVFHMPGSFRSFGSGGVGLSQTFVVAEGGARVLTRGPAEPVLLP
ncbi:M24 family metallopeptidase [Streptomyces sulphureus]|uniref:M24 family metallopeptidase n=1 Tax=Streptomyces sulphureus TaxID=47758 RepID=UPI00035DD905|nr:Xaa-Pro peptidase family protein [Streptomyces sulphureus]